MRDEWEQAMWRAPNNNHPMQRTEAAMENLKIDDVGEARLYTSWVPSNYAKKIGDSQSLGSMLTFTGSAQTAWATTTSEVCTNFGPLLLKISRNLAL